MTPAVPDPTVEARDVRTDSFERVLNDHKWSLNADFCNCGHYVGSRMLSVHKWHLAEVFAARAVTPDDLRDRLQALCDAAMRNKWHLGAEAVSLTVAQVLAVVGEDA